MKKRTMTVICIFALIALASSYAAHAKDITTASDTLAQMVTDLQTGVDNMANDFKEAARKIAAVEFTGDNARAILSDLCRRHSAYAVDCAAIDKKGVMVTIEPKPYDRFEGADISKQEITIDVDRTKKLVMSDVFFTVEKIPAISFQGPVTSPKGEWLGQLSILFKPDLFIKDLIKKATSWSIYEAWVMQKDGKFLYNPDPAQNGLNIFTNPYNKNLTELVNLGKMITDQPQGTDIFHYLGTGRAGRLAKRCTWQTLDLYNTEWRVVLVEKL